ncbi:hypothetical protein [Metabacillus fastidiosus]|uniref:hypothetical protein n=1 Tax=Metabacillus fastidiosus TaxID=1458 RepID=UPI003D289331
MNKLHTKFETGQLIFVRGKSPLSFLIRLFDGEFSHVGIALSENALLETQYLKNAQIVKMNYKDYEIVDLKLTDEQKQLLKLKAIDLVGRQYDYKQFFMEALRKIFKFKGKNKWNSPTQDICSELIVYLLLQINWFGDKGTDCIDCLLDATPNQFYKIIKELAK